VVDSDLIGGAVSALAHQLEGHTWGKGLEADNGDPVVIMSKADNTAKLVYGPTDLQRK
jgi:hypothetical protein